MQYIVAYSPKTSSKELDNPNKLQLRNGKTHPTCCLQSLHPKGSKYDLASQQGNPLQQNNRHLDIQVYVQIQVTRHFTQSQTTHHFRMRLEHCYSIINQINTHHNLSEIMILSPETIVITILLPNRKKKARNF